MLIKAIMLYRLRAVSDFLFHFLLWLTLMKRQFVTDFLPTVLIHLRHKLCLREYSPSRPFWHILCVSYRLWMRPKLKVFRCAPRTHTHTHTRTHTHTHTFQPGEQRLSCGLCFQRLFIKHVQQFSNSKDGILQQSPIELILTLSLGFREERMCEGKKKRGYNA